MSRYVENIRIRPLYTLVSFIVHTGSTLGCHGSSKKRVREVGADHYICYRRNSVGIWYEMDDRVKGVGKEVAFAKITLSRAVAMCYVLTTD